MCKIDSPVFSAAQAAGLLRAWLSAAQVAAAAAAAQRCLAPLRQWAAPLSPLVQVPAQGAAAGVGAARAGLAAVARAALGAVGLTWSPG